MTPRRWRALGVAVFAALLTGLGILAVFLSTRLAGLALSVAVMLLGLLLYREIERAAELRLRTAAAERLLANATTSLEMAEAMDSITRLANRARFFVQLRQEFQRSLRYHRPLACVLLDLDRFSSINEQYGEHFGDAVLAECASLVAGDLRESDLAARYEGEAFALLLPETTAPQAVTVAERIRSRFKGHVFSNGVVACSVSASFGIAGLPDPRIRRTDDLVRLAMQALEEAKRRGRDRIVTDLPPEPPAGPPVKAPVVTPHAGREVPPADDGPTLQQEAAPL